MKDIDVKVFSVQKYTVREVIRVKRKHIILLFPVCNRLGSWFAVLGCQYKGYFYIPMCVDISAT